MKETVMEVAKAEDFEAVCTLYDEVIAENTGSTYDVLWNRELHPSDAQISDAIAEGHLLLARRKGDIVGAMIMNNDTADGYESVSWGIEVGPEDVCVIHLFCIHPSMQGKKIGRHFLMAAVEHARNMGMKAIRLDVFDHNIPAKKLYETSGFVSRDITKLGYEDQDAVGDIDFNMMELVL